MKTTWRPINYVFLSVILVYFSNLAYGQNRISVIPQPNQIKFIHGSTSLDQIAISINDNSLRQIKDELEVKLVNKYKLTVKDPQATKNILLQLIDEDWMEEAYELVIAEEEISIKASDPHGVFNGVQTLLQMVYNESKSSSSIKLPLCKINDQPRFSWRGFMLDESRHFYGKEKVMQTLDLMALHKLNVFHWHLTDAPGWRIEIKKYPKLTEVGAKGNQSNPTAPTTFYTQREIKELVAYAAERYIQIIPEIDMPGHLSAAMLAYPEYSGGGTKRHPNFTINPGKEETYQFLTDILREVSELFPAPYIHIGGDEVSFGNKQWATDSHVLKLQKENDLADLKEVENYFIRRMYDSVVSLNKKFVGWDEIANVQVGTDQSVVMWWRHKHTDILDHLIQKNYKIVLCPRIPMYLDFVQDSAHQYGRRWAGEFCDLEKVYKFPDGLSINMEDSKIQGIQGNLWTDRISSENSFDFMTWPRLTAIAEAAWINGKQKDFDQFLQKLKEMRQVYDDFGLYYYDYFNPHKREEPEGSGPQRWQENHVMPE